MQVVVAAQDHAALVVVVSRGSLAGVGLPPVRGGGNGTEPFVRAVPPERVVAGRLRARPFEAPSSPSRDACIVRDHFKGSDRDGFVQMNKVA